MRIFRVILAILLIMSTVVMGSIFVGIGFVGGVVLKSWEVVKKVDLEQLEYRKDVDTWQQHLEIYSSICTVQRDDSIDFLLRKLERLGYEETQQGYIKPSLPGQYTKTFGSSRNSGIMWIYLLGFHYPYTDRKPYRVEMEVRDRRVESIRNDVGEYLTSFDLQPELISELYGKGGGARELISLTDMPETLLKAFLAVEDKRFYRHWGVDTIAIGRAVLRNITDGTLQGASTITQQLTRNIYLTREKRILRKIKEALLAVRIERAFSKDEIFERYLNLINLGRYGPREVFGVQEAANSYFGKPVWELEVQECATLAGIPKSPTLYSPIRNPKESINRRNLVLGLMRNANYISQETYEVSLATPLAVDAPEDNQRREAGHFIEHVHQQLADMEHLNDRLYNQGLKVYTTLDMSMQEIAEQAVANHLRQLDKGFSNLPDYDGNKLDPNGINPKKNYLQAALVAMEPQTGYIRSMVGGRDYYIARGKFNFFNRAHALRQPGSAFKPIVLAAFFNLPVPLATPATVVRDEAWSSISDLWKKWTPRNYTDRYYGNVTLRTVLEKSINVATAKLMNDPHTVKLGNETDGIKRTIAFAKRLGIESKLPEYPSLSLGAGDLTLLELTSAYSVFANGGIRAEPCSIQYIEDRNGELLFENDIKPKRVVAESVAFVITNVMKGVIENGTGRRAIRSGLIRPAAGKTGTTDDYKDAWFVGYTPRLASGVWVGFDDPEKKNKRSQGEGAKAALPIWATFMIEGARGPIEDFREPPGVVFHEIDKETGLLKYPGKCDPKNIIREAFLEGYAPTMLCTAHN
ncbi:MAG: PBP1A family penicillin-binding protein [Candidatus Poribacteria bacterium]|nr:PBP1A family penicillin-binding protein [Candidatus Poribacteria bacterium]MDE0506132.1 PBP1A family penicillin-binding protein [Candidatus Poribacteria bacterium]